MTLRPFARITLLGLLSLSLAPLGGAQSADAPSAEKLPAPPAAEAPADDFPAMDAPAAGEAGEGGSLNAAVDIGFDFDKLSAESIQYSSSGELRMIGNVIIKSPQLNLESAEMQINQETQVMTATGNPVEIQQGDVKAECKNFRYDIEKKSSRLTGSPIIIQRTKTGYTRIKGDIITIVQDSSGKPSVNVAMLPNSTHQPVIEQVQNPNAKKDSAKRAPARKVDSATDRELIKLPEMN